MSFARHSSQADAIKKTENISEGKTEQSSSAATGNEARGIYVGVRLRPSLDAGEHIRSPVSVDSARNTIECPDAGASREKQSAFTFSFDKVFNGFDGQQEVMNSIGSVAVQRVLCGYNGTVLCYGQSGSGKTHTMIGPGGGRLDSIRAISSNSKDEGNWEELQVGLLPRMIRSLFTDLSAKFPDGYTVNGERNPLFSVEISAVELYNEELRDLIPSSFQATSAARSVSPFPTAATEDEEPTPSKPQSVKPSPLPPRLDSRRGSVATRSTTLSSVSPGRSPQDRPSPASAAVPLKICQSSSCSNGASGASVFIEGLSRHRVHSFSEAMKAVEVALQERKISSTRLNSRSNRSHIIFFLFLCQKEAATDAGEDDLLMEVKNSVLTLVDLAGSERVSQTRAEGLQLLEAQRINLSLTLLGNVIQRLTTRVSEKTHIPYRDSKLTRLLQDSFGGNAVTFLLCNISPEERNRSETLSSLRFAQVAKKVRNKATINASVCTGSVEKQLKKACDYIAWLEKQLEAVATRDLSMLAPGAPPAPRVGGAPSPNLAYPSDAVCCTERPCAQDTVATWPHSRSDINNECESHSYQKSFIPREREEYTPSRRVTDNILEENGVQRPPQGIRSLFADPSESSFRRNSAGLRAAPAAFGRGNAAPRHHEEAAQENEKDDTYASGRHAVSATRLQRSPSLREPVLTFALPTALSPPEGDAEDGARVSSGMYSVLPVPTSCGGPADEDEPLPHVPHFDSLEDASQQFTLSYGPCVSVSGADRLQYHPLSTPSVDTLALHPLTSQPGGAGNDWEEPDLGEFISHRSDAVQKPRSAIQRMMDAIKLAAAVAKSAE